MLNHINLKGFAVDTHSSSPRYSIITQEGHQFKKKKGSWNKWDSLSIQGHSTAFDPLMYKENWNESLIMTP